MDNHVELTRGSLSVRGNSTFVAGRESEESRVSPLSANSQVVSYCPFEVQPRLLQDSRRREVVGMTGRRYPTKS